MGQDFNPRPREGGDFDQQNSLNKLCTFQSTPPRGGRRAGSAVGSPGVKFQSTPPRGGRRLVYSRSAERPHFNPRPREGGDGRDSDVAAKSHAFQSTPPRGGRLNYLLHVVHRHLFQSTPPRGGRPAALVSVSARGYFNPRPREGGDFPAPCNIHRCCISIHAPARGATTRFSQPSGLSWHFNPRPREGGDASIHQL